jgi:hypothetical protein
MKKFMGVILGFFAMSFSAQSSNTPVFKNLDGQCPSGYCACVGCNQCSPNNNPSGCTDAGCLPNCAEVTPSATLYSVTGQGAIFYCPEGTTIQDVTNVPREYATQKWYTCGSAPVSFPPTNVPPTPLSTAFGSYSFESQSIFACPPGESANLVRDIWYTCSNPEEVPTPLPSASATEKP